MMTAGQLTIIGLCCLLVLSIGAIVSIVTGRKVNTEDGWHVAGRSLPLWVAVLTQFATATGGGVLVAHVGNSYENGWAYWFYPGFVFLGFILLSFIARWLREQEFTTIPEILRRIYSVNPVVTVLASLAAIVVPFGWLATQYVAFASLFSEMTGMSSITLTIIMGVITLVFVLPGGLRSVAYSDAILAGLMLIFSAVVVIYALNMADGWSGIREAVPTEITSFPQGLAAAGGMTILLWAFSILPGTLTNQMYFQRVFALGNIKKARAVMLLGGALVFIGSLYPFLLGLSTRALNGSFTDDPEAASGWFLTQLPIGLLALFAAFLMITIATTTSSALQSVVTNVVQDIMVDVTGYKNKDTRQVSRLVAVIVVILSAVLALAFPAALAWLVATYAYSAAILFAPIFIGYFFSKKDGRLHSWTAIASMLGGLIVCAGAHVMDTTIPYAIYGIGASVICLLVAHAILGRSTTTEQSAPALSQEVK